MTHQRLEQQSQSQSLFPWPDSVKKSPGKAIGDNVHKTKLFSPIRIKDKTFKNRIVVSPMCQYSAEDGFLSDWHLVHLGQFAVGGAALVFTEATAVSPVGRLSPYDLGLWKEEHLPGLQRVVRFIHEQDSLAGMQIGHAGRKGSTNPPFIGGERRVEDSGLAWNTVGPSAIPWSDHHTMPQELTIEEIQQIVRDFVETTKRADQCGFDVLEVHGAHGYLISSFLSPTSNQRTDHYGGSFENRIRFALEVAEAVREAWPQSKPLWMRLSSVEWVEGGWTLEETVELSKRLKAIGFDVIDASSGGNNSQQQIKPTLGYQVPFASTIRKEANIATGAVGLIVKPGQAEEILQKGDADFVLLAREFLRDPHWPLTAARELGVDIEYAPQYERSKRNTSSTAPHTAAIAVQKQ